MSAGGGETITAQKAKNRRIKRVKVEIPHALCQSRQSALVASTEREKGGEGRKLWRTTNAFNTQLTFVYVAHVATADAAGACVTSVCKVRWHELQLQHQQHKLQLLVFASCSWQLSLSAAEEGNFLPAASTKLFACKCNENWHLHVAMLGKRQHVLPGEEEPRKEFPPPPHSIMQSMARTACKSFVSYLPV